MLCFLFVNSEGFLAEVFHPWVRWEGPGSGFENSSGGGAGGGAGGLWQRRLGGPKLGPSGWAQAGPKWVGPGYTDLAPLGLRSKNKVFERAWGMTGQKCQGVGLKLKAFILTFPD